MIEGGYALMPRVLFESEFWMTSSHLCRCLWVYLWGQANHAPRNNIQRGQLFTTLNKLAEALSYRAGYRLERPKKGAIWGGLRKLREANAIETTKTTRGLIITIVNYDKYQTASNYEVNNEKPTKFLRSRREPLHYTQEGRSKKKEEQQEGSDIPVDDSDGVSFGGPFRPPAEPTRAVMNESRRIILDMWRPSGADTIPKLDDWLKQLARDNGGPHTLIAHCRTFRVDDFKAAWAAFRGRKNRQQTWTGTWVANARTKRRSDGYAHQERTTAAALEADRRETENMPPEVAALAAQVSTMTDDERRDAEWYAIPAMEKKKLVDATRESLGGVGSAAIINQTARDRWWAGRKGNGYD